MRLDIKFVKDMKDKHILEIVRLSCVSNDLTSNIETIGEFPKKESMYFFYKKISIVREIAKLVKYLSENTETLLKGCESSKALPLADDP